jgi:16S rRNA (uracil1498-N3)-methyltransferase
MLTTTRLRGYSLVVKPLPSKQVSSVRFRLAAPARSTSVEIEVERRSAVTCVRQASRRLRVSTSPQTGGKPRRVNLVLFDPDELGMPLLRSDPRAMHILEVLRRPAGESFDAGVTDGARGRATVRRITSDWIEWDFAPGPALPPLPPTTLLLGLARPQTSRDILRDATTLGATALHFAATARSDPNYASSSLWRTGEWRRHVLAGAAQAFDPRLPDVTWGKELAGTLDGLAAQGVRYALDNYEADAHLASALSATHTAGHPPLVLAIGPERGWDSNDRNLLRARGFRLVHLGTRVLRTETAVVAALTLVSAWREITPG